MSRHRAVLSSLLDTLYPSLPEEAARAREAGNELGAYAYALSASDLPFFVEQVSCWALCRHPGPLLLFKGAGRVRHTLHPPCAGGGIHRAPGARNSAGARAVRPCTLIAALFVRLLVQRTNNALHAGSLICWSGAPGRSPWAARLPSPGTSRFAPRSQTSRISSASSCCSAGPTRACWSSKRRGTRADSLWRACNPLCCTASLC